MAAMASQKSYAIGLLMVKNESRIIERCMRACAPAIVAFCICDTGSSDDTVAIAERVAASLQKPIRVFNHTWKNFGHNRSLSFKACQQYCKDQGWVPEITYALALDGDMVLSGDFTLTNKLTHKGYHLMQKAGQLEYLNTRLLRLDIPWTCKCATHEYWDGPLDGGCVKGMWIDDRNDGGSKSDKFERDERLLLEDLKEDPKNVRTHFYLAQTYKCLGRNDDAIIWYKKRIALGGWFEEVWYSHYQICLAYLHKGMPEKAEVWAELGFKFNSYRSEAFYALCKHFREISKHWKAMHYYHLGKKISKPTTALFLEIEIYDYLFDYEYSILQYYVNSVRHEGLRSNVDYYNLGSKVPNLHGVFSNMEFYVQQPRDTKIVDLTVQDNDMYKPSSTSYFYNPEAKTLQMNVRYVNYSIEPNGSYTFRDPEGKCRTRNAVVFGPAITAEVPKLTWMPTDVDLPKIETNVLGLEDVRIFRAGAKTYFTATTKEYSDKVRIMLGEYNVRLIESDDEEGPSIFGKPTYSNCRILEPPQPSDCEKNWAPIHDALDSEPRFVYGWHPIRVGKVDASNKLEITHSVDSPYFFNNMRGSTPLYKVEGANEYYCLTHVVKYSSPRKYYHCLVYLDSTTYKPIRYSLPFVFQDINIEYCLGADIKNLQLNAIFSRKDSRPAWAHIPLNSLHMVGV